MSRRWHLLSLTCLIGLVLLHGVWHSLWTPPIALSLGAALTIALTPLGLALAACVYELRFGLLLGGIVALFYFCHGVMEAWAVPAARLPALLEASLAALQIASLGLAARAEKRAATVR